MAKISLRGSGNVNEIARYLSDSIQSHAMSCELVDSVYRQLDTYAVQTMVFEKYYMRAENRASLTVMVSGDGETVFVDAIGAGGGQGAIFKFSWGAEKDFVAIVPDLLREKGFR
ncbi:DUF6054 family protein [Christensenellaceae bacterium OttesenSCG-928-M15]|nr:DUF6054 family protein [Christensenellaceae bacterium OttesenSCG-928-M15]